MVNSGAVVTATFATPDGASGYDGETAIDGVPGTGAPILLASPTRPARRPAACCPPAASGDLIDGVEVTCVDNGMPVVVARAADLGISGSESPEALADDDELTARVQSLRIAAGKLMGLGDVTGLSVPKTSLVSAPRDGGDDRHADLHPGPGAHLDRRARRGERGDRAAARRRRRRRRAGRVRRATGHRVDVEHPTGHLTVDVELDRPPTRRSCSARASSAPPASSSTESSSRRPTACLPPAEPQISARWDPPMPLLHDVAHLGHVELLTPEPEREPVVLHPGPRPDRERRQRRLGLPAHLGRLRAPQPEAHRVGHVRHPPHRPARGQPGRPAAARRGDRGGRPGRRLAGRRPSASGPPTCSAIPTVTSSSCTTRRSGTGRPAS